MYFYFYNVNEYKLFISEADEGITHLELLKPDEPTYHLITDNMESRETPLIVKAYREISAYLNGTLKKFTVPIAPQGTEFQKKVWHALAQIPYGETRTYKEIAIAVGNPNASRAVGNANNKNPIMLIVPCHRVIGSNGKLVGFRGGVDIKRWLLGLEGIPYEKYPA